MLMLCYVLGFEFVRVVDHVMSRDMLGGGGELGQLVFSLKDQFPVPVISLLTRCIRLSSPAQLDAWQPLAPLHLPCRLCLRFHPPSSHLTLYCRTFSPEFYGPTVTGTNSMNSSTGELSATLIPASTSRDLMIRPYDTVRIFSSTEITRFWYIVIHSGTHVQVSDQDRAG